LHRGVRGFDLNAKSRKVLHEVAQREKEEKGKGEREKYDKTKV
jgi:hypothetical protein